jgi:CheY-like chemotaxis protein
LQATVVFALRPRGWLGARADTSGGDDRAKLGQVVGMRALLIGLREAAAVAAKVLLARGHVVDVRSATDPIAPGWLDEPYDLVVDRWPGAGRLGFTSWAASACGDPFILTILDGDPGFDIVEALLGAGTDDVIAGSALERLLGERILVIEHHAFRRAARTKSEAVTVRDVSEAPESSREPAENVAPVAKSAVGVADVLVVDDDIDLGNAFRRVLRKHRVTVLTRAKDALDVLDAGREFDLIFSDLMMPEMSGMDFHAEALRRFPAAAEQMIFVTGGAFTPAAVSFLQRVPNLRLEKPFEPAAVRELVRDLIETRVAPLESGTMELRPKREGALSARPALQEDRPRRLLSTRGK